MRRTRSHMANNCHRLTHASDTDQNLLHEVVGLEWHNFHATILVVESANQRCDYVENIDKLKTESALFKTEIIYKIIVNRNIENIFIQRQ